MSLRVPVSILFLCLRRVIFADLSVEPAQRVALNELADNPHSLLQATNET